MPIYAYTPLTYNPASASPAPEVFLFQTSNVIQKTFFPHRGLQRTLSADAPVIGQDFQQRFRRGTALEKNTYKFDSRFVTFEGNEYYTLYQFWIDRMEDDEFFWLPSFKKDYNVVSVAGDNKTITITDTYQQTVTVTRHVAIWKTGEMTSEPDFRKLTTMNDTQIVLDTALSGITTSAVIMNLFYVKFLSDNFNLKSVHNTCLETSLSFIEDQRNTPT